MTTPIVAFVLQATEYERGWGSRPDGHVIFKTEADADKFLAKVAADRRNVTVAPDEYTNYDKLGYKEVKVEVIEALERSPQDFIWTTRNQKFLKDT